MPVLEKRVAFRAAAHRARACVRARARGRAQISFEYLLLVAAAVLFIVFGTVLIYYIVTSAQRSAANQTEAYITRLVPPGDTTPPGVFGVRSESITHDAALIVWITDEESNSSVNYNTTPSLGVIVGNASLATSHAIQLTGLSPSTRYYYRVTSCDASGNCNTAELLNFTTIASP